MTRETKIGLLVGLAFIIVIGILLSDQLMRSTEPPAAPRASVADTVRAGTATPVSSHPPVTQVGPTASDVAPEAAVPMREEIVKRPPPVTFVEIKPGGVVPVVGGGVTNEGQAPVKPQVGAPTGAVAQKSSGVAGVGPVPYVTPVPPEEPSPQGRTIAEVAAQFGETLVGPDGLPLRAKQPAGAKPAAAGPVGMKHYVVEPGDSLSRIAQRQMGGNTKANRDAIIKANPSLQENPDRVIIGQTYNIPVPTPGGSTPVAQPNEKAPLAQPPIQPGERTAQAQQAKSAAPGEFVYTVKEGDSLWKIAKDQCGDPAAVAAIKELNKDVLKGDTVVVSTKLRLPAARPVASLR